MEQVREALDALWSEPERAEEILGELRAENEGLYRFEEMLASQDEKSV